MTSQENKLRAAAKTMVEALPYIQRFRNKTIVVKYGGNAMIDEDLKSSFIRDIIFMKCVGINPVVVHGGGPQISTAIKAAGLNTRFVEGLRITDRATMNIVEHVIVNQVNSAIAEMFAQQGSHAIRLGGSKNGRFIRAENLNIDVIDPITDAPVDLKFVGQVNSFDLDILNDARFKHSIPVVAPVGLDDQGRSYNINADTVAGELAEALVAEKLIIVTNTAGVMDGDGAVISEMSSDDVQANITSGVITAGMLPKIRCAMHALNAGVNAVHIVDGRLEHSVLLEVFTDGGVGTLIHL